jgi:hypothetical protein
VVFVHHGNALARLALLNSANGMRQTDDTRARNDQVKA